METFLLEDRRYYVYVYLDTRKHGNFEYNEYKFNYEPIYIGKGKGYRFKTHLKTAFKKEWHTYSYPFYRKIRKIYKLNVQPKILFLKENLTDKEAICFEKLLIKKIGRKNLNSGPLTNLTDGGETFLGAVRYYGPISLEHRIKIGKSLKGQKRTDEQKRHYKEAFRKLWNDKEFRKRHKEACIKRTTVDYKKKISNAIAKKWENKQYRKKQRKSSLYIWQIIYPNNKKKKITDLEKWCIKNNVSRSSCKNSYKYKKRVKGFLIEKKFKIKVNE